MNDRGEYARQEVLIQRHLNLSARMPEQVFCTPLASTSILEFDHVFDGRFFANVQALAARGGSVSVLFAVLEPHPDRYFYKHFGLFPVLRFGTTQSPDDFLAALRVDPGDSPADSLLYRSEVVAMYPDRGSWLLYGDRNMEIAIIGAFDEAAASLIASHPPAPLFSAEEAIDELLRPVFRGRLSSEVRAKFVQNYGHRGGASAEGG